MFSRFPSFPIARFKAGDARRAGFNITIDPEGDIPDHSPEHVELTISNPEASRSSRQKAAKALALRCELVRNPAAEEPKT
jgi:hypothetical protein